MSTDKTVTISCRISKENADKIRVLEKKSGKTFREMVEGIVSGVNTLDDGVNTKNAPKSVNTKGKSVNTNTENAKNVVNNSVNTTFESVNTQLMIPERIYNDFLAMAKCFGMRYEIFMSEINRLLNEGNLYVDDGKLHSKDSRLKTEAFFKKCEELGCKYREQDVLDKLVKGMVKK